MPAALFDRSMRLFSCTCLACVFSRAGLCCAVLCCEPGDFVIMWSVCCRLTICLCEHQLKFVSAASSPAVVSACLSLFFDRVLVLCCVVLCARGLCLRAASLGVYKED